MGMTVDLTRRLLRLGYSQDAANSVVVLHLSNGALDELVARVELEEAGYSV